MTNPLKKILLVEDDPDIQLITRLSLEIGGGYDVHVCASGADAVESVRAYAPDLILLDMMMPGMDGLATMDALRSLPGTAATPLVFFTANTQAQVMQDLLRRGALGVIVKPVEPDSLVEQIRALWQRVAPAPPAS
ncbi:MAG: response regulator [Burkholderiales bacterium]|nr:response regulator [Burkholderiales bacterium]